MEEETKPVDRNERLGFWARIAEWWDDHFYEQYEVTVWFCKQTTISEHGLQSMMHTEPKVFQMREVHKHNHNLIKGKDINGNPLEIRAKQPFDYNIRKLN
jgi:hypothetical protein